MVEPSLGESPGRSPSVALVVSGLIGNVVIHRFLGNDLLDSQVMGKWQNRKTNGQSQEIERIQSQSRVEMEAVGLTLGCDASASAANRGVRRASGRSQLDEGDFVLPTPPRSAGLNRRRTDHRLRLRRVPARRGYAGGPDQSTGRRTRSARIVARESEVPEEVALAGRPIKLAGCRRGSVDVSIRIPRGELHAGVDFAGKPGSELRLREVSSRSQVTRTATDA